MSAKLDTIITWINNTNKEIKQVQMDLCWAKARRASMLEVAQLEKKLNELQDHKTNLLQEKLEVQEERKVIFRQRKTHKDMVNRGQREKEYTPQAREHKEDISFGSLQECMDSKALMKLRRRLNK